MSLELLVGVVLVLLAVGFVAYPLVGARSATGSGPAGSADEDSTQARRRAIYNEILDLELEHRIGKLSQADYQELTDACLARAAALLAEEDAQHSAAAERVEREIAAMREALRSSALAGARGRETA